MEKIIDKLKKKDTLIIKTVIYKNQKNEKIMNIYCNSCVLIL